MKLIMGVLSHKIRKQAKDRGVSYSFLFMRASGNQLTQITSLIDSGFFIAPDRRSDISHSKKPGRP